MRFNILFFLISLSLLCLALAQVSYDDCCLKYVKKMTHFQKHAVKYRRQEMDGGCNIRAIIFTMRRGRKFCANPGEDWVVKLMKKVDTRVVTARAHHKQWPNKG